MAFFGSLFNLFKKTEFNDEVANQLFFGIVKAGFKTLPEAVRAEYAPENRSKSTKIGQARETALKVLDAGLKVMATENREYYKIYHAFEEKYTKIIEQFYLKNQIKDPTVAEQILADAVIRLVHSILIGEYKEKRVDKEDIEHKEKGSKFNTYFQEKCRSAVTSWRDRYKLYQSKHTDTPEEFLGFKNRYGTEISLDEERKKISSLGINPDKDMTEEDVDTEL